MTQTFYPFSNSPILTQEQWSKVAQNWLSTGVIKGQLNELQVYADSTGLQVKVKSGQSFLKGHFYESDSEEILAIGSASSNPRIDRVIVRLDWIANTIQLSVLQGVSAVSPVAPALTQNSSRWEIGLAQITVGANASTIAAGNVTDERNFVGNANVYHEKWITATSQNGWVQDGTRPVQFYKDSFGIVRFRGKMTPGILTSGTTIFVLPAGYRPGKEHDQIIKMFTSSNALNYTTLSISDTGNVRIYDNMDINNIRLDNVQFRAES